MKTGCHANTLSADGGAERIIDYYRRSKAKTFKTMEFDRGVFQEIKRVSPGCIIIGRIYDSEQSLSNDAQEQFINKSVAMARQYPEVDFWEGYNECYSAAGEGIDKFARMEVARVEALAGVNARAAVGCFSCGRPPIGEGNAGNDGWAAWRQFRPALDAVMAHGGALALHSYDAPWMSRMVEGNLWDPRAEGWLCLRYRKVVRWLRSQGITMYHPTTAPGGLAILLTETGVDGGVTNRPGHQGGGWGDFQDSPDPKLGDYAQQRRWYAWQVSQDAYVRGLTSFGECSADPTWRSFGLFYDTGMTDKIIAAESDLPDWHYSATAPAPTPQPTPLPVPPPPPVPASVGPFAAVEVLRGEGRLSVARRAFGLPAGTPNAAQKAALVKLEAANVGRTWGAGDWLRVPGRKVAE